MGWIDVLFGRPLASWEDQGERISPVQGIPIFGLDALSSAAYGPEAALTILLTTRFDRGSLHCSVDRRGDRAAHHCLF